MSTTAKPQHLPTVYADTCNQCHRRVFFRCLRSRVQAEGRFRIVYLCCPECGAKATRLVEIVARPPA